jgi:hypothetical protein
MNEKKKERKLQASSKEDYQIFIKYNYGKVKKELGKDAIKSDIYKTLYNKWKEIPEEEKTVIMKDLKEKNSKDEEKKIKKERRIKLREERIEKKKDKKNKKEKKEKSEKIEKIEKKEKKNIKSDEESVTEEKIKNKNIESDEESVTEEKIEIPQKKEFLFDINIIINNDEIIEIIKRFPKNYQEDFINNVPNNENIIDFVFDINNYPYVVLSKGNEKRIHFSETKVSSDYINQIIEDLYFLDNNRSGIDKTLHRISIKKNVKDEIDGVTIRVGRLIIGISSILDDIIEQNKSILFLGYH